MSQSYITTTQEIMSNMLTNAHYAHIFTMEFVTPYHPLFMLLDVTSRLTPYNLLLPPTSDPAANAPRFLPAADNILIIYLLT